MQKGTKGFGRVLAFVLVLCLALGIVSPMALAAPEAEASIADLVQATQPTQPEEKISSLGMEDSYGIPLEMNMWLWMFMEQADAMLMAELSNEEVYEGSGIYVDIATFFHIPSISAGADGFLFMIIQYDTRLEYDSINFGDADGYLLKEANGKYYGVYYPNSNYSGTTYTSATRAAYMDIQGFFAVDNLRVLFTEPETAPPLFLDIGDHWAEDDIMIMYFNGLVSGTSQTHFSPEGSVTRGMVVTILWRLMDEPSSSTTFSDVASGQYYTTAVGWGADNNIVTGYTDGTFKPDDPVTRQDMAVLLHRFAQYLDHNPNATTSLSGYTDAGQIADYATEGVQWAVANGLMSGKTATTLDPTGGATRAEFCRIIVNYTTAFPA